MNERMYSVGKIPGGFNKREGKASENAVLTCRVIDRPMRPLFPKDYRNDVTLEQPGTFCRTGLLSGADSDAWCSHCNQHFRYSV